MTKMVWAFVLVVLCGGLALAAQDDWTAPPDPKAAPVAKWIWGKSPAHDKEVREFRVTFDPKLPTTQMTENPSSALLFAAGDNEITVYVNGKLVAQTNDWGNAVIADVRSVLTAGKNVIAVRCVNHEGPGGICLKLAVRGQYREPFFLVTDEHWKTNGEEVDGKASVPRGWRAKNFNDSAFQGCRVLGDYGMAPWGTLTIGPANFTATTVDHLTLPSGFKAELLYSVPRNTQGSWVSMANDPKGRLYVSDQSGPLFRVTVGKSAEETKVEQVPCDMGSAQGLLWAHDSLYVVINGKYHERGAGLYRLTDTNGDDQLDHIDKLLDIKDRAGTGPAGGEHGPHAVVLGPDEKLYVIAGNFTGLPAGLSKNSPAAHWAEDLLLPREPDGRGHDPNIMAPGGWVCRMDPDGKNIEAFATGMRNSYDMAFNRDAELITFDSDMEWDIGAPWYRPIRICHLVSGGEFGWRNGSGKWPTYYPDSLPPVVNVGLGSPTGVVFGYNAKFPARYQQAFFANDWAYGKIYAVFLQPHGASYTGTFEPFVVGKPFDVTDIVVNTDGAMYVLIGGRSTQSGLYRITYVGNESTAPVVPPRDQAAARARDIRHRLESFHGHVNPAAVAFAWPYLGSDDRALRFAARVAIEAQPAWQWQTLALNENDPTAATNGLLALCRVGDKSLQADILAALDRLNFSSLTREQRLELLRVYGVCFIRMGKPDSATLSRYAARFDAEFPAGDAEMDHELGQLLVYCSSPTIVTQSMNLLAHARTQEEQMFWTFILRYEKTGWTPRQREAYFEWFQMAQEEYTGGASFIPFLQHIRNEAIATLTAEEKKTLAPLLKDMPPRTMTTNTKPRPFVRHWTMADLTPKLAEVDHGRNFASGKAAFAALSCVRCHRFADQGSGSVGPDITGVGQRFNTHDILESIVLPSKVISDQYADTVVVTRSQGASVGAILSEDADNVILRPSPLSPLTETIAKKEIVSRGLSKVSPMPEGLLDVLKENEVLDLLAYVRAGGKANDPAFAK
jgi:putative heme-binding domain-containing protein